MKICWCFCGSFCTLPKVYAELEKVCRDNTVIPVGSINFSTTDTRFGKCGMWLDLAQKACGRNVITTVSETEPIGPLEKPDITVIAPCTGNTLSKLASGISDTPVTLAAKSHLRNRRPLLIALASNDALAANFKNIAALFEKKHVYFVPLIQDDPERKPSSLVCDFTLLPSAISAALEGKQLLPLFG